MKIFDEDCVIEGQTGDKYFDHFHAVGAYSDDVTEFLRATIKPGWQCMDVGANIGLTSIFMARCSENVDVIAFEPSPAVLKFLNQNVDTNGRGQIRIAPVGLGEKSDLVQFIELPNFSAGSHISNNKGTHPDAANQQSIYVPITTLDEYCKAEKISRLDLLKIDAEGYELNILRGAKKCLRGLKPLVVLEFNSWFMTQVQQIEPATVLDELFSVFASVSAIREQDGGVDAIDNTPAGRAEFLARNQAKGCVNNLVCRI
jgi:FkbM family methyltransferase